MATAPLNENIRRLADSEFRLQEQDLRVASIQRLAEIDSHHISDGMYNTSRRLSRRHAAQMESLRAVLQCRVRTVAGAYETAGAQLDDSSHRYMLDEVHRICAEHHSALGQDARSENEKSHLGAYSTQSLLGAIGRDVGREQMRAAQLIQAEEAKSALVRASAHRNAAVPAGVAAAGQVSEPPANPLLAPSILTARGTGDAPAGDPGTVSEQQNLSKRRLQVEYPFGKRKTGHVAAKVTRVRAGQPLGTASINGDARVMLFRVVHACSRRRPGTDLVPWEEIERVFHARYTFPKEARRLARQELAGRPDGTKDRFQSRQTLVTYAQRIHRILREGGIGDMWLHTTDGGARLSP
jgi:hypothetical protein